MTIPRLCIAALALIVVISPVWAGDPPLTSFEPPATQVLKICGRTGWPLPGTDVRPAWYCEYVLSGPMTNNYYSANCEYFAAKFTKHFKDEGRGESYAVCEPLY